VVVVWLCCQNHAVAWSNQPPPQNFNDLWDTSFCTAAPAWYEFLCGPITAAQINTMQAFLEGDIIPFAADQAQVAARLFNAAERPRRLRVDAMIAATAISRQAALATLNTADFKPFTSHGLVLAIPPEP
jgi:predicted nucleic acid-binding protein